MTDRALDELSTIACNPKTSRSELRRVALVAIGELSMLRNEHAQLKEQSVTTVNTPRQAAA
jgi:hypothetical protein